MQTGDTPTDPVSTVNTAFEILEVLHEREGASLTTLADELDLAKSTVHRHLQTLHHRKYVVCEKNRYHLSLRFLEFGEHGQTRKKGYSMAEEKVRELAEKTGERAQFLVEEHGETVYVHRETGSNAVLTDPGIGKRIPLHMTSAGKAILAHLPKERVERIFDRYGLVSATEYTETDPEVLFEEFERIRERGYSINRQENVKGLHALGTVIRDGNGTILGAISVSGPGNRLKGPFFEEELPNLLLGTANELELNIAHA
ncbi:IclR family transcriptional regulator [Haladaptatus caseinilyticus]|uniref:IclR family transcriptional regulator n=1 Tax=Haladaptatus caseinilyticus TaxID=2993314 RepID=UPI00224AF503|nr:IclR family transcriptional regulator [Haladaptatus caseinilyticus]